MKYESYCTVQYSTLPSQRATVPKDFILLFFFGGGFGSFFPERSLLGRYVVGRKGKRK